MKQGVVAFFCIGKEVDQGGHVVVDHQGEIGVGGSQIGAGLGHNVRVHLEGYVLRHVGGRLLLLLDKAVALLEGLHLEDVDAVHDAVELLLQLGIALDVDAAGEHQVHGAIELQLGLAQTPLVIFSLAAGVGVIDLLDQQAHPLLLTGGLMRRWNGGLRGLSRVCA